MLKRASDCLVEEDEELMTTGSRGASGEEEVVSSRSVMTDNGSEV